MHRKLAVILAADVVGYSRLMHDDEEGTLAALKAHQRELIDPKTVEYRGRIIKRMGDGLLMEFSSVVDAVRFAIDVQQEMSRRNANITENRKMLHRIGINLGDVIVDDDDLHGDGVNVAARLETLASPGGICLSGTVYDQLAGKIAQDIRDMGDQYLKNIEDPVRAYQILGDDAISGKAGQKQQATLTTDLGFGAPQRPSIAILPFKNLSSDPNQDFLAEGLRLGILSSLIQLSGLFLVGTDSVNGYRNRDVAPAQAGLEAGVNYILSGAVQQAGARFRATLHLTDVAANEIVWSERYDKDIDDLFKVQDEITQEVLVSLDVHLIGGESSRIWFDDITTPEVRELFHRGVSHVYAGTQDDNAAALRHLEELHRAQPQTDHASSLISYIHMTDAMFGWSKSESQSLDQAAKWAEIAVGFEKNNGIGHIVMGHLKLLAREHDQALAHCNLATEIRASCPFAHGMLANVLNYCGDSLDAVKHAREALLIERIYPPWLINILAAAYRDSGKIGLSIPAAKEALRLEPEQTEARIILCSGYNLEGLCDRAQEVAKELIGADPTFRLSTYAERQPYRHRETLDQLIEVLSDAGLPE